MKVKYMTNFEKKIMKKLLKIAPFDKLNFKKCEGKKELFYWEEVLGGKCNKR